MVNNHWLVVTGTMEFGMTFQKQLGMEWNYHPNWRTPSFFRGVGRKTTNQLQYGERSTSYFTFFLHIHVEWIYINICHIWRSP